MPTTNKAPNPVTGLSATTSLVCAFRGRRERVTVLRCSRPDVESKLTISEQWRRCVDTPGSAVAWNEFIRDTHALVAGIASRAARQWNVCDQSDVDDLTQDIYLKLSAVARSSARYFPDDDQGLLSYLKTTAANAARDALRSRFASKRGAHATFEIGDRLETLIGQRGAQDIDRGVLLQELDGLIAAPDRERALFWLYYRQGLTAREIAAIPSVALTAKGVESLLHRMTEALKARLASLPSKRGGGFEQ